MLPDATVRYAEHDDAVIDLHVPASPGGRLVVLLHGGFWKAQWDRRHPRDMARALADLGWLVATPEYRRVGNGGGWPTTGDDVRRAVGRLPELLAGLDLPVGPMPQYEIAARLIKPEDSKEDYIRSLQKHAEVDEPEEARPDSDDSREDAASRQVTEEELLRALTSEAQRRAEPQPEPEADYEE